MHWFVCGAFDGCSSLTAFEIPAEVKEIGDNTFRGCESAVSIVVPDKIQSIGEGAFDGCNSLNNVTIPNNVTDIAEDLFNGTNLYSADNEEDVSLFASELVFTCSEGSAAYEYAQRKGIATNVVPESELDIRKTATTISVLSDGSYLFDVVNSRDMSGILHVELYDDNANLVSEEIMSTQGEVEYRVKVSAEVMSKVAFANIYISDENGERVSTEDEVIAYGEIFTPVKSDIKIIYNNGVISFSGTTEIRSGAKLFEVIYNGDGSMYKVNIYDVSNVEDEITVSGKVSDRRIKFMLWENMQSMRPMAEAVRE